MIQAFFDNPAAVIVTVGALVGIASSLVGVFLVLRRTAMLSDAISHSVLLGIVVFFFLVEDVHSPLLIVGAALAGLLTVALTEVLTRTGLVKEDAAIGLTFPALFALAVLLINLYAENVHIDVHAVLLGEIAFSWLDTWALFGFDVPKSIVVMGTIALANGLFVALLFKELKLSTFDRGLATALGFAPAVLHYALLAMTSVTAVGAFDAVGAVLVVAFVIVPPSAAYLLTDNLAGMIGLSILIVVASSVLGYWSAIQLDVSISGMMACFTGVFLTASLLAGPRYGLVAQALRHRRLRVEHAERMLVVHLYNHEDGPNEEASVEALQTHLRWTPAKSAQALDRSVDRELVEQFDDTPNLRLTDKGRALARSIVRP